MFFSEVIGRAEAVAAGADDDRVILGFRFRKTPLLRPIAVGAQRLFSEIEK